MTAEAAKGVVVRGLMYCGVKRTVQMAVGGAGASVVRGNATGGRQAVGQVRLRNQAVGVLGHEMDRPAGGTVTTGVCFWYGKAGHWKNECPSSGDIDTRECFTCRLRGDISRVCPQRVGAAALETVGGKDESRMEHGPDERRMGPNERD